MPKGPQGQKRPADAIGLAVMVGRIATGEIADDADLDTQVRRAAKAKGGIARASALTPKKRSAIARKAAAARWTETEAGPGKKEPQEL
jgi:hypothetical protein